MSEEQKTEKKMLWILICDIGYVYTVVPFYAVSEAAAEQWAQEWIERQGPRILSRVSLRPHPYGFRTNHTDLPGYIEER